MNLLSCLKLAIENKEIPPFSVLLVGARNPTKEERLYGASLEHLTFAPSDTATPTGKRSQSSEENQSQKIV